MPRRETMGASALQPRMARGAAALRSVSTVSDAPMTPNEQTPSGGAFAGSRFRAC